MKRRQRRENWKLRTEQNRTRPREPRRQSDNLSEGDSGQYATSAVDFECPQRICVLKKLNNSNNNYKRNERKVKPVKREGRGKQNFL